MVARTFLLLVCISTFVGVVSLSPRNSHDAVSAFLQNKSLRFLITSIHPKSGPITGNTPIVLEGGGNISEFSQVVDDDVLTCRFESLRRYYDDDDEDISEVDENKDHTERVSVPALWISPKSIQCLTPRWSVARVNVSVALEFKETRVALAPHEFYYHEQLVISSIFPSFGSPVGGTNVTIYASGLEPLPGLACRFGYLDRTAVWMGKGIATCETPSGMVGTTSTLAVTLNGLDFSASNTTFRYSEFPIVTSIWPKKGSLVGGSNLTLVGKGFEDSPYLQCQFHSMNYESSIVVEAKFVSSSKLMCRSPSVKAPMDKMVHVSVNGVDRSMNGVPFQFIQDAAIQSIFPNSGPSSGGTVISLKCADLAFGSNDVFCRFGNVIEVRGYQLSTSKIECVTPRWTSDNVDINVTISLNGADFSSQFVQFRFFKEPVITSIHPAFGAVIGGTHVRVRGDDFFPTAEIFCSFGASVVKAEHSNADEVICVTPTGAIGASPLVSLSFNGGVDFSPSSVMFRYAELPSLRSIQPNKGTLRGGTILTIEGSGFENSTKLECFFFLANGESIHKSARFLSTTMIECTNPPSHTPGRVEIKVTNNGVETSMLGRDFEYKMDAIVSSIRPMNGPISGGTSVALYGNGFFESEFMGCRFGFSTVAANWISPNLVRCQSPQHTIGSVELSFTNDGVHFTSTGMNFSFTVPLKVRDVQPRFASRNRSTVVTLLGNGFTGDKRWKCKFGRIKVAASLVSSTEMTCPSPGSSENIVSLWVLNDVGDEVDVGVPFHYYDDLHVFGVFPEMAPLAGNTSVHIKLNEADPASSYTCVFGEKNVNAMLVNDTYIECVTPRWESQGRTTLAVQSLNAIFTLTSDPQPFLFYTPPVVERVTPLSLYMSSQVQLVIIGDGFLNSPQLKCLVGNQECSARWKNESTILCDAPKMISPDSGNVSLAISINGVSTHDSGVQLKVFPDFQLTSINPSSGPTTGRTVVRVFGTGFVDTFQYFCLFGLKRSTAEFKNSNELRCESTFETETGVRSFWICAGKGFCLESETHYNFTESLHVLNVSPKTGPISGGTEIDVTCNFPIGNNAFCFFGDQAAKISPKPGSSDHIGSCTSPPYSNDSDQFAVVDLTVSLGHYHSQEVFHFKYHPIVEISAVSIMENASILQVLGKNIPYNPILTCIIGNVEGLRATWISPNEIWCFSPPELIGAFPVAIKYGEEGDTLSNSIVFNFMIDPILSDHRSHSQIARNNASTDILTKSDNNFEFPKLHHLEPRSLIVSETGMIMIKGENFHYRQDLVCLFDPINVTTLAAYLSDSEIICHVPSSIRPGKYLVTVFYSNNQRGIKRDAICCAKQLKLQVFGSPSIASVYRGITTPGNNVTLIGTSFNPELRCRFDKRIITNTYFINSTLLKCLFPRISPSKAGAIDLILNNSPISSIQNRHLISFLDISISSISPMFGYVHGGTNVSIALNDATSESAITHCIFGQKAVPVVTFGTGIVVCTAPAADIPGSASLGVSADEGESFSMSPISFEYTLPATFTSIQPGHGPESGGTQVTLVGTNFISRSSAVSCLFGSIRVVCRLVSSEELICETPAMRPGRYEIKVSFNSFDLIRTSLSFVVHPRMTTLFAVPTFGTFDGGTVVKVFGTNFRGDDSLSCYFGNASVEAMYFDSTMILCLTPFWGVIDAVDLTIWSKNGHKVRVHGGFYFYSPYHLSTMHPNSGVLGGGTEVTLLGSNFSSDHGLVRCLFNDTAVTANVVSPNEIVCVTPQSSQKSEVEVSVMYGYDIFTLESLTFSYDCDIQLTAIVPDVIGRSAETIVKVFGNNFSHRSELTCFIADAGMRLKATFIKETEVHCLVPKDLKPESYNISVSNNGVEFSNHSLELKVLDPFLVHSISPTKGSLDVTPNIVLNGAKFQDVANLSCLVAHQYWVPSSFIDSSKIECPIPRLLRPGNISIELFVNTFPISIGPPLIFFLIDLSFSSISPMFGYVHGGTNVSIALNDATSESAITHCIFGQKAVPVVTFGTGIVVCKAPAADIPGSASLGVSADEGESFSMSPISFEYTPPATFTSIQPGHGPESGGTQVTLVGTNFISRSSAVSCLFGSIRVVCRLVSSEELICETPAMRPGRYEIKVSFNHVDWSTSQLYYRFYQQIGIESAVPSIASSDGGTNISIFGNSFFVSSLIACKFGDVAIVPADFISRNQLSCTSPEVSFEIEDLMEASIQVSMNGVDYAPSSARFHFSPPIKLFSIHPNRGHPGTQIAVNGTNFHSTYGKIVCVIGNNTVRAEVLSSTQLSCIAPPQEVEDTLALLSIVVDHHVDPKLVPQPFHYIPKFKNVSIKPNSGSSRGGTLVTVKGLHFDNSTRLLCRFGKLNVSVMAISSTQIQCASPKHPPGFVDFGLVSDGADVISNCAVFEYYSPFQIFSIQPSSVSFNGGTLVVVQGKSFRSDVRYNCNFGGIQTPGRYLSLDKIECTSPIAPAFARNQSKIMLFTVSEENSNYTGSNLHFVYTPLPILRRISPRHIFSKGSETLSIYGDNLMNAASDSWCRFFPMVSEMKERHLVQAVQVHDDGRIDCIIPPYPSDEYQEIYVEVSSNMVDWSAKKLLLTKTPQPVITSITPGSGPVKGGLPLIISGENFFHESVILCDFGPAGSTQARWLSTTKITCLTPSVTFPTNVLVSLRYEGSEKITDVNHPFMYYRDISIASASPMRGFVTGGTIVKITGSGFIGTSTMSCSFGGYQVFARYASKSLIECMSPPFNSSGATELQVSINGYDFVRLPGQIHDRSFLYDEEVYLLEAIPHVIPIQSNLGNQGGKELHIEILGSGFVNSNGLACLFGKNEVKKSYFVSESKVLCPLPHLTSVGTIDVKVSLNGVDFSNSSVSVSVIDTVRIVNIFPSLIEKGSRWNISLSLANFVPAAKWYCCFGNRTCQSTNPSTTQRLGQISARGFDIQTKSGWVLAQQVNSTMLSCQTPPLNLTHDGTEWIGVMNERHLISNLFPFKVYSKSRFLSIEPKLGYVTGGTKVTLTFNTIQFFSNLMCQFGDSIPTEANSHKSYIVPGSFLLEVTCITPKYYVSGPITVKLLSNGHSIAAGVFEFINRPQILQIFPFNGRVQGGSVVIVSGSGFTGATTCKFGTLGIVPAKVEDDNRLNCTSPASISPLDVLMGLSHNNQDFVTSNIVYQYRAEPRILMIAPSYGYFSGTKDLYIVGENFIDSPLASCRFGQKESSNAFVVSASLLRCKSPSLAEGLYAIFVTMNGVDYIGIETFSFNVLGPPQIKTIRPKFGTRNTKMILKTSNISSTGNLSCHFGDRVVTATIESTNSVSCIVPKMNKNGTVNVSLSIDGENSLDDKNSFEFSYVDEPVVTRIFPRVGWTVGGALISVAVEGLDPFCVYKIFCSFGDSFNFTQALEVRRNEVLCKSPPFHNDSMKRHASIILAIDNGVSKSYHKSPPFSYIQSSLITKIDPPVGSVSGGSLVRVHGIDFVNIESLCCLFDNVPISAIFVSDKELLCESPEWNHMPKVVKVNVAAANGTLLTSASNASFQYLKNPVIHEIDPSYGKASGGTSVQIKAPELDDWPDVESYLSCRFGNSTLTRVVSNGIDGITCISPPLHEAMLISNQAQVSIYAHHGDVYLSSSLQRFVYVNPIEIRSLLPTSGPLSGNTEVLVDANIDVVETDDLVCIFGTEIAQVKIRNKDIICISPPMTDYSQAEKVLVRLGVKGALNVSSTGQIFIYYKSPSLHSLHPSYGFFEGGEEVLIIGSNFRNDVGFTCSFGNVTARKSIWISPSLAICTSPGLQNPSSSSLNVQVRISNNGVDFADTNEDWNKTNHYLFIDRPDASAVNPDVASWDRNTTLTISGKGMRFVTSCIFGDTNHSYPIIDTSTNKVKCTVPAVSTFHPLPAISKAAFRLPILLGLDDGIVPTKLEISYMAPIIDAYSAESQPVIKSIKPMHGSSSGNEWIQIHGMGFINRNELACVFEDLESEDTIFLSSSEILCKTPKHLPGSVSFGVSNGVSSLENATSNWKFTFVPDALFSSITPTQGTLSGGTLVTIVGLFPSSSFVKSPHSILCRFGRNGFVEATVFNLNQVSCITPRSDSPKSVEISLSFDGDNNFRSSNIWYSYQNEIEILKLTPNYGYKSMDGTSVLIHGRNFWNSTDLKCTFGSTSVPAMFLSPNIVSCKPPLYNSTRTGSLAVSVAYYGDDYVRSWKDFRYFDLPQIESIEPVLGSSIVVMGRGFHNTLQIICKFGQTLVQARVINATTMTCKIPHHVHGGVDVRIYDQYAQYLLPFEGNSHFQFQPRPTFIPRSSVTGIGEAIFIRGANFDAAGNTTCGQLSMAKSIAIGLSDSLFACHEEPAQFAYPEHKNIPTRSHEKNSRLVRYRTKSSPNGTMILLPAAHNFTFCKPGSFQPRDNQKYCLLCPVGYICPNYGMTSPILCPAGFICSKLGLQTPVASCVAGHYCLPGTKSQLSIANSTTETWILNDESGVITVATNSDVWNYVARSSPATGTRRLRHPPNTNSTIGQMPYPCPIGHFCRDGVSSVVHKEGDFSTPQLCFDGFFCPRGSVSPEGSGPCRTGYYCNSNSMATICEPGFYCPGTGNMFPLPCFPGTYSPSPGLSNCLLCSVGYQCPGFARTSAELCEPGFVCDEVGLSFPSKLCPNGFYCAKGTMTDDPNYIQKAPIPCPHGVFCLEGVAHNLTNSWLPSFEKGRFSPQECEEGNFCPENSASPMKNSCFPGHFCPPNTGYPIPVPRGSFAGEEGSAIVPSLCLPGTFSSRPGSISCSPCPAGFSCLNYGTFIPRICGPGTYRSKADSIPCKLCPKRTFSSSSGLTDISKCFPCPSGRVCGDQGMSDLRRSNDCPEGYFCDYVTGRSSQFSHKCAGGSYCFHQTTVERQYIDQCAEGNYCRRGTAKKFETRDKCGKNHFCPAGTSSPDPIMTRCPRQTASTFGSKRMDVSCSIQHVAICDKMTAHELYPFDAFSYYPHDNRNIEISEMSENLVVKKIMPFNEKNKRVIKWKNDTVEVFRACPSYGFKRESNEESKKDMITVIGRNFRNSSSLTCRYRFCVSTSWQGASGEDLFTPCDVSTSTDDLNAAGVIFIPGTYITESRVSCQLPDLANEKVFHPVNKKATKNTFINICLRDDAGRMFLSQKCDGVETKTGNCDFEPAAPGDGLRRRLYSLFIGCTNEDIKRGICDNIPSINSKINPCLTSKLFVDVSNSGKIFSGDKVVADYSLSGAQINGSHASLPTSAVYYYISEMPSSMEMNKMDVRQNFYSHLHSDSWICHREIVRQEGRRRDQEGWFESPYMSRIHLSFNWSHIPDYLTFDEHYKLAIYVRPSRCNKLECTSTGRRISEVENIPCLQPLGLPSWFTDNITMRNNILNLTLLSLDDARFRVEVHIINGLALPYAEYFKDTMTTFIDYPQRAKYIYNQSEKRIISPLLNHEEKSIDMVHMFGIRYDQDHSTHVSPPMNLPPRWKNFERGRMLIGLNTTLGKRPPKLKYAHNSDADNFWNNPYSSVDDAKQHTDTYLETFHGLIYDVSDGSHAYDLESLILPYLPYFSNCREFDSYIPLWAVVESTSQCNLPEVTKDFPSSWWRRNIPPIPHQDDVIAVGPFDFMRFYPVADWCERKIRCNYDETLSDTGTAPRWFEGDTGVSLFSIIRDPIDYHEYTGRDSSAIGKADGGGQKYVRAANSFEQFVPATIDRSAALSAEGGCTIMCFPRKVTLDIAYYQMDHKTKRIVQTNVIYDEFDKDFTSDDYELHIKFYPLNYQELIIKFAFSHNLFLLLFAQIGTATVFVAMVYWFVTRLTTNLENPPPLRLYGFLSIIIPPAFLGFILGLFPVSVATAAVFWLLKGFSVFALKTDPTGRNWLFLPSLRLQYRNASGDPDNLFISQQGRAGLSFVTIGIVSMYYTAKAFVPDRTWSAQHGIPRSCYDLGAREVNSWKRSNLIYSSILMGLFLVIIMEWSFWPSFGVYIWEAIILMKTLSIILGAIVDAQIGDNLLSAPVMTAMGLVQGIVTMSSKDFMDFLLSYIVGFGFLILERMYIGPLQSNAFNWLHHVVVKAIERLKEILGWVDKTRSSDGDGNQISGEEATETLEPLIGSFASYSCDTLSLLYTPFIMIVVVVFRDEAEITKLYGIKESDMEFYVLFALTIIPFQLIADMFLQNALELLHGWKILGYLEFCNYRFQQREFRWKPFENANAIDECIDESFRNLDQLCFSSQYYMLNTIHVNAIVYFVIGCEMMARAKYNLFADPATFIIVSIICLFCAFLKALMIVLGNLLGVWHVKYERRNWQLQVLQNEEPISEVQENINRTRHDIYQVEKRLSTDAFRYKFLNYNRPWLISALPSMLTPRTIQRSRPFLINNLSRVLGQINLDISSDSESEDNGLKFDSRPLTFTSRAMLRKWLQQAVRRIRLNEIVQPLIQQSRGGECEICLSRNLLQVEPMYSFEAMDQQFIFQHGDEIDQVLWKKFWQMNQRYHTICLPCIQRRTKQEQNELIEDNMSPNEPGPLAQKEKLNQTNIAILKQWYKTAKTRKKTQTDS